MKQKSHPSTLGVLRLSAEKAGGHQGEDGEALCNVLQKPARIVHAAPSQRENAIVLLEQHLLRCLCAVCLWWLPWGCQASRSAGRRPQGQGWGQGSLNCHSWKQTSHRRERGNKRQKYLDCCSSARIEYLHPVASTRTWPDQAKAHQKASSYRGKFAGLVLVSIDKHRKAGCAAWKAQNAQYGARGYEDATPLARLSRPCRQGPAAALIGPSGS